ncbi:MAG: hypothetical protein M3220_19820 [Chloroflexota bacterium]|nr:hypothetical protein [Chloroflexota bacterium]
MVLDGARSYLKEGGLVFLSISYQYGQQRVERLSEEIAGFVHRGILASTDWVPFDLSRPDLLRCLELYAQVERQGALEYTFQHPAALGDEPMNAQAALSHFRTTGHSPVTKWQTHLFEYEGET